MMSRVRQVAKFLGKSGIDFLITLALYLVFYFTGHGALALLAFLALIPPGVILVFRGLRYLQRNSLWSVRNRLLFVYGLIGFLPILLLFVLVGLGAWALMNELAIYLARSALDRRLELVQAVVNTFDRMPSDIRLPAAPEVLKSFAYDLPGINIYIRDEEGEHRFPKDAPTLTVPAGWQNTHGLMMIGGHAFGWAHQNTSDGAIAALAPLSDQTVENLVPNLGIIALVETDSAGGSNPDFRFNTEGKGTGLPNSRNRLPPAMSRFDVPVGWPSTLPHYHLETPNKPYQGVLWVYSRPSAVLRTFFSGPEILRGVLFDVVIAIAILFLIVELVAVVIGISLARRITRAVNQLYEGTRQVIFGDFRHRIPVRAQDQLGELSHSFNQMTGNLERLLVVEKEKERLQTELEIAREVQSQLYPKEAPPIHGLQLTVRCDPARMVSGDYYDYQEIGEKKLSFAIGDVAGKGISAALLMATIQAALRAQLAQYQISRENECAHVPEIDVASLVSQLNRQVFANTSPEKYATFFFALFDEVSRTLTYTNAGHLSPLLFRNGDVMPLDSNGMVVGAFPFARYNESCLVLNPGDLLVCYTDGITEPENAYGDEFGEERLIELVHKHYHEDNHEIIRIILDAVRSWTGVPELHDDMTLLLARQVQRP
ncbi:MAG TPA: SpoIIE family protein phosphatase [Bryobacteraceae bacterium]|jgi:sigma-B regulation protein RsbU (phosphoserine phosphatase)